MLKIKTKILFLLSLISIYNSNCSIGCLKCTEDNNCLICDNLDFYILSDNKCELKQIDNCQKIEVNGDCTQCKPDYFLDTIQCVIVPEGNRIENCEIYFSESTCLKCSSGMYLYQNACVSAIVSIDGCMFHNIDGKTCEICQEDRIKSLDSKLCDVINKEENCSSFNYIDCKECRKGFFQNRNNYLIQASVELNSPNSLFMDSRENVFNKKYNIGQSHFSTCARITIENCFELTDYDQCAKCQDGYFLTPEKSCKIFPEDNIPYCETYSDRNNCSKCINKYYMKKENLCEITQEIDKCIDYNRELDKVCVICEDGYFSKGDNCGLREKSLEIENCEIFTNNDDTCELCENGYELNFEKTKCLNKINFCIEYEKTGDTLTCLKCGDGYFLKLNLCEVGNLDNCKTYLSEKKCESCKNKYYLNPESLCSLNEFFDTFFCLISHPIYKNFCEKCKDNRVKIPMDGLCRPTTVIIQNCEKYSDEKTCVKCKESISYLEEGKCILGNIEKCSKYASNQNICIICSIDFSTVTSYIPFPVNERNNSCVKLDFNTQQDCGEIDLHSDHADCEYCNTNFYPFTFQTINNYYCVSKDDFKLPSSGNYNNCLYFDLNSNKCQRCEIGKVILNPQGTCGDSCSQNQIVSFLSSNLNDVDNVFADNFLYCTPNDKVLTSFETNPISCAIYDSEYSNPLELYCAKCSLDSTYIGEVDTTNKAITLDYLPIVGEINKNASNRITPVVRCLSREIILSGNISSNQTLVATFLKDGNNVPSSLDNCRYIKKIGSSDKYGCVACNHGYSGKVIKDTDNQGYLISKCELIEKCLTSNYFYGLGALEDQLNDELKLSLDFFVSCHACTGGLIPTFARTSAVITGSSYSSSETYPDTLAHFIAPFGFTTDATKKPYEVHLSKPSSITSCQTNGLDKVITLNCAIQELIIDKLVQNTEVYNNERNPRCVACLPGYKPVMTELLDGSKYISACQTILNCDLVKSKTFNKCDSCAGKYSLNYNSDFINGYSDGLSCVFGSSNCFIYDDINKGCVKCNEGSILNPDGICDMVNLSNCENIGFVEPLNEKFLNNFTNFGLGCNKCEDGYIGIKFEEENHTQCILSSYLQTGKSYETSFILIKNCAYYTRIEEEENKTICHECFPEFIISKNKKICYPKNISIKNCSIYTDNGESCSLCNEKYYVNDEGKCISGNISYCLVYENQSTCLKCEDGFIIINNMNKKICFKNPDLFCDEFLKEELDKSKFICNKCLKNHFYSKNSVEIGEFPLYHCLEIPDIDNCIKYNNIPETADANLNCSECERNYFVENGKCSLRIYKVIEECEEYFIDKDKCEKCSKGNYIDENGLCRIYPIGIKDCLMYISNTECIKCKKQRFLNGLICEEIPIIEEIKNCKYYKSSTECLECNENFYLKDAITCIEGVANDCFTFENENKCETCRDGYGLIENAGLVSCTKIVIPNCEISNPIVNKEGNFECKECYISFYINSEKTCTAVPALISFCTIYDGPDECYFCLEGYVLSKDKRSCTKELAVTAFADGNCENSNELVNPVCNTCKEGYYFLNINCVSCDEVLGDGCLICDLKAKAECLLCKSGYYMDDKQNCILSFKEPEEIIIEFDQKILVVQILLILFTF